MNTRFLRAVLPLCILAAGCKPTADFKVSLRVVDDETGKPISNALVFVEARAQAEPPREPPFNQAVVSAWGETDSEGFARIRRVQGFHWGVEPRDNFWKMLESRKPKVKRMIASIEGGSVLVFARDYGALHHPFGIVDNPRFQEESKKGGYAGLVGQRGFKGEDRLIEFNIKGLKEGKELVLRMSKPDNPEYLSASLSVYGLSTIWPATSRKTGMTGAQQEQVYQYFVDSILPVIQASTSAVAQAQWEGLTSPETKEWFVSPYHAKDMANHDTVVHAWMTQKALELLPPGYEEPKEYALAIQEGVRDEDALARSLNHFYNPNDPGFGMMGGEPSLKWGAIGYPDNPSNEWDFADAVRYYQAGDKTKAYKALGHVLHLLEDLSAPMHTHAIAHEYTLLPAAARFETYFSKLAKANNNSLPPEYNLEAKDPKRIKDLKEGFEAVARLTFGAFSQDGKQVRFEDYCSWKQGTTGNVVKAPEDETLVLMGKYLFPKTIEAGAGLIKRFHDALHPEQFVQKPKDKGENSVQGTGQSTTTDDASRQAQGSAVAGNQLPEEASPMPWEKLHGFARHMALSRVKGSRKINITPTQQLGGIGTGFVMAYGHIIPPPYQIEWQRNRLLINGVQVVPSLVLEREKKTTHITVTEDERQAFEREDELETELRELYRSGIGDKSLEDLQAAIVARIMKSTAVYANPRWTGKDSLEVQLSASLATYFITFSARPSVKLSKEALQRIEADNTSKAHASALDSIRKRLGKGYAVYFFSDGKEGGSPGDVRPRVNQIMQMPGFSREQQIEMLKERVFHHYSPALDVVDNYNPGEWKMK